MSDKQPTFRRVPEKWVDFLVNQAETGMGYWVVSVRLKNGHTYDRVVINNGFITQVHGYNNIPFEPEEIIEMRITHDRWRFNA